jgi:hypothetical protein
MIFRFVVKHLRWLARLPLAPDLFDAFLLSWTALTNRKRLAAMESVEDIALRLEGVRLKHHRFGGIGFAAGGHEFAHLHGNGLLDVHLTRDLAATAVAQGIAKPHHVLGPSAWVSIWIDSKEHHSEIESILKKAHGLPAHDGCLVAGVRVPRIQRRSCGPVLNRSGLHWPDGSTAVKSKVDVWNNCG